MYNIKVNNKYDFQIEPSKDGFLVNDTSIELDTNVQNPNNVHVIYNNKSYSIELVGVNDDKSQIIKVNGTEYTVVVKDKFDQLLQQLGMDNLTNAKLLDLKAPMPGLVLNILVEVGQEVKKGDSLVVLEAMKMENILKAPADGIVSKVPVRIGDKLEKGTLIIQFK